MKNTEFLKRAKKHFAQIVRYLIAGGIGAGVEVVLFALLAWKVFPALREEKHFSCRQ